MDLQLLGALSLLMLEACASRAGPLPTNYVVLWTASGMVESQADARRRLAEAPLGQVLYAVSDSGRLAVSVEPADVEAAEDHRYRVERVRSVVARMVAAGGGSDGIVRVSGAGRAILVPADAFLEWFERVNCQDCALSIGPPPMNAPAGVVAEARWK